MRTRFMVSISFVLAVGCGSGASGSLTATFDAGGTQSDLDAGCTLTDRDTSFDLAATGDGVGVEATWPMTAIGAPGALVGDAAAGVFLSVEYDGAVVPADGSISFTTYDPTGAGVAGMIAWTVDSPALTITGSFDCPP